MTGKKPRRSVTDRARRRAIRALAGRLGVAYSVAARLLAQPLRDAGAGIATLFPVGEDKHRAWLFAMREQRTYHLRLHDTRLAADLPLGRAAHLAERFPPLRRLRAGFAPLYDGEGRQAAIAMLYAVLAHEAPTRLPAAEELDWVAGLGEETAVDLICAAVDRAARLLLDENPWRLFTRIETALAALMDSESRDAARTLSPQFRTLIPRRSLAGARHTLDALLVAAHNGHHPPGAEVQLLGGPWEGRHAVVIGARWQEQGPPTHYEVRVDAAEAIVTVDATDVAAPESETEVVPA
ncbi:MAG TPA: hypothetical protein VF062_12980 [Candidatus Limnocylindrales bacterium]